MIAPARGARALAAILLMASGGALAADATVSLEAADGAWNGESRLDLPAADRYQEARLWVPRDARIQAVVVQLAEGGFAASWTAAGPDAILVAAPPDATGVLVRFDLADRRPWLVRYVAPEGVDRVTLRVLAPEGALPESPDATFVDGVATATVRSGDAVAVRVVPAERVGELPLLVAVGGLSLVVLLGTLVWHRVRPPLGGRAPERFLDHLGELQARLLPPVVLFAAFNLFYFTSGLRVVGGVLLPTWGVDASLSARAFQAVAERLVPPDVQLVVLRPADAVLAQVGMCLFLAFATVLPLLVYEIGAFVAPGLETRERRVATRTLPLVTGLFLVGSLLGYLVLAPIMIRTLYSYAPGLGAAPLLAVGDLVAFALLIILALGVAFELPVGMYVLARLGLVRARTFGRYVRHAILAIVVVAGLLTPDPSVVSQLLLAVPIVALYLLGIAAAAWGERARSGAGA